MMGYDQLWNHIETQKIKLWFEGDKLKFQGRREDVTPEVVESLRQHKDKLIDRIRHAIEDTPLDTFSRSGYTLGVQSDSYGELVFAPDTAGVCDESRPTYRASELKVMLAAKDKGLWTEKQMHLLHEIKKQLGGTLSEVRALGNYEA